MNPVQLESENWGLNVFTAPVSVDVSRSFTAHCFALIFYNLVMPFAARHGHLKYHGGNRDLNQASSR